MVGMSLPFWLLIMAVLGAGIVVSWRLERESRTKVVSIILSFLFLLMFTLKYFYSLVWPIVFAAMLIILLKKFGSVILLWIPIAFFVWLPYPLPLPSFIARLLTQSSIIETAILILFFSWIIYALSMPRLRNDAIQRPTPYWQWLGLFALGGTLAFFVGSLLRPILGFEFQAAFVFLRQTCFISFFLYVLVVQRIRKIKDAEAIMIALLLGAAVMAFFIIRGERPEGYRIPVIPELNRVEYMGYFLLPFGLLLPVGGNTASAYFAMVGLLSFSLWLNGESRGKKFVGFCAFIFTCIMIVLLSTRGIWVSMLLSIFLLLFLSAKQRRGSLRKGIIGLLAVIGITYIIYSVFNTTEINERIESLVHRDMLQQDENYLTRVEQYPALGSVFLRNILGVGYMHRYATGIIHPHSLYLKLGLMTGIIGLISYLFFLILFTRYCYTRLRFVSQGSWIVNGAIAVLFLIFFYGFTGDVLARFYTNTTFILICSLAMVVVQANKET